MKKTCIRQFIVSILAGIILFSTTVFADLEKMKIAQIVQNGNEVYLYVNALDELNNPVDVPGNVNVVINNQEKQRILASEICGTLSEGVAYTFCIDISKSVTEEEMAEVKTSMSTFVNNMPACDCVKIITAGESVETVCNMTSDKSTLLNAINGIERTANKTYLYKAITDAVESMRKTDYSVPKHSAIVLFTDGMDDSTGAYGLTRVMKVLGEIHAPVYTVILKGSDASASPEDVVDIAYTSGGLEFVYDENTISEAITKIQSIMYHTYRMTIIPEDFYFKSGLSDMKWQVKCVTDSGEVSSAAYTYPLSMEGVVLETPVPISSPTLIPTPTSLPAPTTSLTSTPIPTVKPTAVPTSIPTTAEKLVDFVKVNAAICVVAVMMIFVLIILIIVLFVRKYKKVSDSFKHDNPNSSEGKFYESDGETVFESNTTLFGSGLNDEMTTGGSLDEEKTVDGSFDNEVTVDGSAGCIYIDFKITFAGQTQTINRPLYKELILGRGPGCDVDVVLGSVSENGKQTSRRHALIIAQPDGVYIIDQSKNKTYLNDMEVTGEIILRDGDVLRLGRATVIVRFVK